ncbi:leucine-rich PPR motif-containing protein, mitochondrial [Pieris rapae]|uniref:leucine-rich PPR motif-containing protein, mitochondrial n=1 Tax=Pieris rapae TaxID=64459 RepID=UPI001E27CEB9|nr:leucine-rich PPR motif-containing protein, mitochondrial [Pieris rapae]
MLTRQMFTRLIQRKLFLNRKLLPICCQSENLQYRQIRIVTGCEREHSSDKISSKNRILLSGALPKDFTKSTKNLSPEDLLEKLIANLSSDIYQRHRVYKNDLIRVINKIKEVQFSTKKQELLLISCCSELLPDETPAARMILVEDIWNTIKCHTKFDVDHYNELLRVYVANKRTVIPNNFIDQMLPVKPNNTTYELLLKALSEAGDINRATEVISNMKALEIPASENVFNSLIVCHGKAGKLSGIQEVTTMMSSLKINKSVETYTAIARAYAWNKKHNMLLDEMKKAKNNEIQFDEIHIMEIVKSLAEVVNYEPVPKVLQYLPEAILKSPSISPYMQSVATLLVFQNHPLVALEIYKCLPLPSFGPKDDQGLHGRSLVRDCVKASLPSSVIALVTQELMSSGRNPIALQNASECALQLGKVPLALEMFTRMKLLGMPLRPHYFWPILLHSSKTYGEKGIMNTLSTMVTMDVKPDYDTILLYVLPFVSFTSPQNLMKKFLETGLNVSSVLTPMMETLLNTGQVRAASEICELFQGKVDCERLIKPLYKGYLMSGDFKSTIHILEDMTTKASDTSKDWIGRCLCQFMKGKSVKDNVNDVLNIAKALSSTSLRISTPACDICLSNIPEDYKNKDDLKEALLNIMDERIKDEGEFFVQNMPHPKHMNEGSLRAHLSELEAKGMNTRGVLRKLLQQYCREGNLPAAREIADRCQKEGVFLSAGMKAAMFDLHVKLGELDLAELTLADLSRSAPNFMLDEFKVIDFATLMVYRKKIGQAFVLIKEQSKKRRVSGGQSISKNCWRLLDAISAQGSHVETRKMFELLNSLNYCKPSNTLLGPLVRAHLKTENFQEAVNEFVRLAKKYNKTPLKHELLCSILRMMGEGKSEDFFLVTEKVNGRYNKMVNTILNVCKTVHGTSDVRLSLIAALADVGYKKTLRQLFLDPKFSFHPEALLRYCERFANEKRLDALEAIAECTKDLRHLDVMEIYNLMLDVYQRDDDYKNALALWTRMQDAEIIPTQRFVRNLCSICKANNKPIPSELSVLLDKVKSANI